MQGRLVKSIGLVSFAWCALALSCHAQQPPRAPAAPVPAAPVVGQQPKAGTVTDLVTMLQSIDPYRASAEVNGNVKVFGSTSMDSMAHTWASGFREFYPNSKVDIAAAGSEDALKQLVTTPTGIAMLSRPVRQDELDALKQQGLKDPQAMVVAREALAVFVNKNNPVQSISGEQLRAIFTTENPTPPTWALLGATGEIANKPIHIVSRTEKSGTQVFLRDYVFGGATMREGVSAFESNAEVLKALNNDPLAIAFIGLKSTGVSVRCLNLTAGNTVIPSDDHSVMIGQYPLMRPMSVIVDMGQTSPDAKTAQEFVHFGLCKAGQTAVIQATFFPVDLPLLRASLQKLQGVQLR